MAYSVKEIYYTLQGEGAQTGRPAVFCRFAGCNLWSGQEQDRAAADCDFCDTDFVGTDGPGGGRFETPEALAQAVAACWHAGAGQGEDGSRPFSANVESPRPAPPPGRPDHTGALWPGGGAGWFRLNGQRASPRPFVVCTGGEPLLQLDRPAVSALHAAGLKVAVETNGTLPAPGGLDWICVSPKAGAALALVAGDELKLVYPQEGAAPEMFHGLDFRHFFLQPMDGQGDGGALRARNTAAAIRYCLAHPRWRLSVQTHKYLGLP